MTPDAKPGYVMWDVEEEQVAIVFRDPDRSELGATTEAFDGFLPETGGRLFADDVGDCGAIRRRDRHGLAGLLVMEQCKHGLTVGTCSRCASPSLSRVGASTEGNKLGGISQVYRGFTILFSPPPDREWSFRPEPGATLQSYKSAFQARRAINELLDGSSEAVPRRDSSKTSQPKSTGVDGSPWSDDELRASIEAYARMLRAEARGAALRKTDVVAELIRASGQTKGSIEMRLQNISAVLNDRGADWIDGFKPLSHYPDRLAELIETEYSDLLGSEGP